MTQIGAESSTKCWNCDKPNCHLRCGQCHIPYYCGRECQVSHWKSKHKQACQAIKKHSNKPYTFKKTRNNSGIGLFATKNINSGTNIIVEGPILYYPQSMVNDITKQYLTIYRQFTRLPPNLQKLILNLSINPSLTPNVNKDEISRILHIINNKHKDQNNENNENKQNKQNSQTLTTQNKKEQSDSAHKAKSISAQTKKQSHATQNPTAMPTAIPTILPSMIPSQVPTLPTTHPTQIPSLLTTPRFVLKCQSKLDVNTCRLNCACVSYFGTLILYTCQKIQYFVVC